MRLMHIKIILCVITLAAGLTPVNEVRAQEQVEQVTLEPPSPRQGYYFSLGLYSLGNINVEKGDNLGLWPGSGLGLRFGQMITRRIGLGLGIDQAGAQGEGEGRQQTSAMMALSLEGQILITDRLALHLGAGVGYSQLTYNEPFPDEDTSLRGAAGASYMVGASYDFFPYRRPLSGGLAISPAIRLRYFPGEATDAVAMFFGVELTWWTGLPKNQLDLPPDKAFSLRD